MANRTLASLTQESSPAAGHWVLIETATESKKLDFAWFTSGSGGGAALAAHLADATDAHDASAISVVPTGAIAATDVQAALAELDTEKQAAATAVVFVNHAANAATARPSGAGMVIWYGSVQPSNMVAPDIVIRTDETA